jgi:hypothetical protein
MKRSANGGGWTKALAAGSVAGQRAAKADGLTECRPFAGIGLPRQRIE